jgi:hypothetical protein
MRYDSMIVHDILEVVTTYFKKNHPRTFLEDLRKTLSKDDSSTAKIQIVYLPNFSQTHY